MSTMQEFYQQLFQALERDSSDCASLLQLTQASPAQLVALKGLLNWGDWHLEAA